MIVVGYPGIGKRILAGTNNCIKLNSSLFYWNGLKENLRNIGIRKYYNVANALSKQGNTVFLSPDPSILKELEKTDEIVLIIYPSLELKDTWIEKLRAQYDETLTGTDYHAWKNAKHRYEDDIKELSKFNPRFLREEIDSIDYDLLKIIKRYHAEFHKSNSNKK